MQTNARFHTMQETHTKFQKIGTKMLEELRSQVTQGNCWRTDGRKDERTDGRTNERTYTCTPVVHAKAGATKTRDHAKLANSDNLNALIEPKWARKRYYQIQKEHPLRSSASKVV